MVSSMTGFGRGTAAYGGGRAVVEVTSLNNRYLDVTCRGLKDYGAAELAVRARVAERLSRGSVTVTVATPGVSPAGRRVVADDALAREFAAEFERVGRLVGLEGRLPPEALALRPDILRVEDTGAPGDDFTAAVLAALDLALDELVKSRATEGQRLARNLAEKIAALTSLYGKIEARAPAVVAAYRAKLAARAAEISAAGPLEPGRLETEIALFAEKSDVSEELVRSRVHLEAFQKALRAEGAVGRRLDFLVVELNREANTVASKAQDAEISSTVIEIKNLLEQVREQVQNLE